MNVTTLLLLLGTVHRDPDGRKKALDAFENLRPDLLLVELSPFGLAFRQAHRVRLHRTLRRHLREAAAARGVSFEEALMHPEIAAIRSQISLPFEYRAAEAFARKRGARLLLVDHSPFSRRWVAAWPELIAADNLAQLLTFPADSPSLSGLYATAARRIARGRFTDFEVFDKGDRESEALWQEREVVMADRIGRAMKGLRPKAPLFIGGWWHLTSGGTLRTLRDLLHVDSERCRLLSDSFKTPAEPH